MCQRRLCQQYHCRQSGEPCHCLRIIIRIFGLLTAIVICGVGVDVYLHGYTNGLLILCASIFLLYVEIKWIITIFLELLFNNYTNNCCLKCWNFNKLFGSWRLSFPYIGFGISLIFWPHNLWLSYLGGFQLILLGILRLSLLCCFDQHQYSNNGKLMGKYNFEKVESGLIIHEEEFLDIPSNLDDEESIDVK